MILRQLKASEIPKLRNEILEKQNGCCAICKKKITEEMGCSLDHQHKLKSKPSGPDGDGLIRGVLCRICNLWDGKIYNNTTRFRRPKNVLERIKKLEELIDYWKKGTYPIIHPSEAPKELKFKKSSYNKLKKIYNKKSKFPEYPKSKKITKPLKLLFKFYNLTPEFYKI